VLLVSYAYDRNARAAYFQQKYPGLSPDEIADTLTPVTTRYAGVAGAGATAGQLSTLGTFGMTAPIFVGAIGAEMIYLARMQMRLILDLSVVYDLRLDPEDPEDVLMVFGYALGVSPTEMLGAAPRVATRAGTRSLVKKYVSKHVLKAIQNFAKKLGFKVLQRTIIKYTVPWPRPPWAAATYYVATRRMGRIAKTHFRHRSEFTSELRHLLAPERTYGPLFPAAVLYMARIDGNFSPKEHELYRDMLSRIKLSE
jgi:hypothetical protein